MTADRSWLEQGSEPLTRTEIDELLLLSEHAFSLAHHALAQAPLIPDQVEAAAGVAQDWLNMWNDVLDLSIHRHWHGDLA